MTDNTGFTLPPFSELVNGVDTGSEGGVSAPIRKNARKRSCRVLVTGNGRVCLDIEGMRPPASITVNGVRYLKVAEETERVSPPVVRATVRSMRGFKPVDPSKSDRFDKVNIQKHLQGLKDRPSQVVDCVCGGILTIGDNKLQLPSAVVHTLLVNFDPKDWVDRVNNASITRLYNSRKFEKDAYYSERRKVIESIMRRRGLEDMIVN